MATLGGVTVSFLHNNAGFGFTPELVLPTPPPPLPCHFLKRTDQSVKHVGGPDDVLYSSMKGYLLLEIGKHF